ncbi:unnamed protein product [Nippostrongylus brasiliensis]|uniref:Uncharacterized protein n=1 Tax=Nippostrongylus brasiliensis TaxID=27835 RepID=A0A3P7BS46_NIPBR|nr:unnamed protein product [Nippostrongylus brasiliensis]
MFQFVSQLDKDEEYVVVNDAPHTENSVLDLCLIFFSKGPGQLYLCRVVQCLVTNAGIWILVWTLLKICSSGNEMSADLFAVLSHLIVLPIFLFTRIVLALWFSDIAGACLRALNLEPAPSIDFSVALSDLFVSLLLGCVFLAQGLLVSYLPLPNVLCSIISFIHLSLLNSMYSFEYFWSSRSVLLHTRIERLEAYLPYFIGFGAPLTFVSTLSSNFLLNGCVFGTFFPLFIISSYKVSQFEPNLCRVLNPLFAQINVQNCS